MLSTYESIGGAAIACNRLIEALIEAEPNIDLTLLVVHKSNNDSRAEKVGSRLALYLEKAFFWLSEKSSKVRFAFSTNSFGTDISNHRAIKAADIIHFHWVNQGYLSLSHIDRLLSLNKTIFWTFHDMWPITGGCHQSGSCMNYTSNCGHCKQFLRKPSATDLSNKVLKRKLQWKQREAIHIIAISKWMAKKVQNSSLFAQNKIYDIPNPINTTVFKPLHKVANKDGHVIKILVVAAFLDNTIKGFGLLLSIAKTLQEKHPGKYKLELVGDISETSKKRISLPFEHHGVIHSEAKMVSLYQQADLLLSTSPSESFSYTCLEALSCGIPIVAFDTGAIKYFVDTFGVGAALRDYTVETFVEAITATNWKKQKTRNQAAYNPFSYGEVGRRMIRVYKGALVHK